MRKEYYVALLGCVAVTILAVMSNNQIGDAQLAAVHSAAQRMEIRMHTTSYAPWNNMNGMVNGNYPGALLPGPQYSTMSGCKICTVLAGTKQSTGIQGQDGTCIVGGTCVGYGVSGPRIKKTFSASTFGGKQSDEVVVLQSFLARKGFLDQKYVTGNFGAKTTDAVKNYQGSCGIEKSGVVGIQTRAKINYDMTAEEKMTNDKLKAAFGRK